MRRFQGFGSRGSGPELTVIGVVPVPRFQLPDFGCSVFGFRNSGAHPRRFAVERTWHIQVSHGQILASRSESYKPFKRYPLCSEGCLIDSRRIQQVCHLGLGFRICGSGFSVTRMFGEGFVFSDTSEMVVRLTAAESSSCFLSFCVPNFGFRNSNQAETEQSLLRSINLKPNR